MTTPAPKELRHLADEMTIAMGTRLNALAIEKLRGCADMLDSLHNRSIEVEAKHYHPQFARAWKEVSNILQPNNQVERQP